jgi:hypothetical protein
MGFNDIELRRIERLVGGFCRSRVPDHLKAKIKVFYEIRGYEVRILECRHSSGKGHLWVELPIARFKYDPDGFKWDLFWRRASGRWMKCPDFEPTNRLQSLIDEIKEDQFGVFWG